MPIKGRRHRLIIYTYLMNRWWRAIFAIGITLLVTAAGLRWLPEYFPKFPVMEVEHWKIWLAGGAGGLAVLLAFLLFALRNSAYIQPFDKYLHFATPFLHLNISYQRLRRTYHEQFQHLFPTKKMRGWRRELVQPLAGQTAVVLEFTNLPVPRWVLRIFLSPFFFPDRTPRLACLVPDWLAFSSELESMRGNYIESLRQPPGRSSVSNILSGIRKHPE